MAFWVREIKINSKWVPDMDEDMCLSGTKDDAQSLLEGFVGGPDDYRVRRYARIKPKRRTEHERADGRS